MLLAAVLSGCMVGPNYTRPKITLPDHYLGANALTAGTAKADLDEWWKGFHDATLDEIVDRVERQNLGIRAAEARLAQARAMARESRADLYPQGDLDVSVVRQRQSLLSPEGRLARAFPGYARDQTLQQIDAGAGWATDLAGGLHRRARASRDEAEAAEADRTGVRTSVVAEAADAYFAIRQVRANQNLLLAQIDADRQLAKLTAVQVAAGVATDRAEDDARTALEADQADLEALRDRLQRQLFRLDVLMGDVPGADPLHLRTSSHTTWSVPGIPAEIHPAALMRRRPDVIAAERRLAAQTEDIGMAMSQYYPTLSLGGLLGFARLGTGNLFESAAFQPALLAGIHWRLFDFGKVDAEVSRARAGHAEALSDYRQSMLRAAEDVEAALSSLARVDAQQRRWRRVANADAQSMASIQRSFRAGASSLVDVLRRKRALLEARRRLATLHTDRARATVAVFRALGGGWSPSNAPALTARAAP